MWLWKEKVQTESLSISKGKEKNSVCLEGKKRTELSVLKAVWWVWDGMSSQCCSFSSWSPAALPRAGNKLKPWSRTELTLQMFFRGEESGLFSGSEIPYWKIEFFLLTLVNGMPRKQSMLVPITSTGRPSAVVGWEFIPFMHTWKDKVFFLFFPFFF